MHIVTDPAFHVTGLLLRTSNERAFGEIPAHWSRFFGEDVASRVTGRADGNVYAVYTDFAHPGIDNLGLYSLVIGVAVASPQAQAGFATVAVPASRRAIFQVERGHPERVSEVWRAIWERGELSKSFLCDFERYQPDGSIDIHVGIR